MSCLLFRNVVASYGRLCSQLFDLVPNYSHSLLIFDILYGCSSKEQGEEVYSVASLLGELVTYRAEGCSHLEALAGIVLPFMEFLVDILRSAPLKHRPLLHHYYKHIMRSMVVPQLCSHICEAVDDLNAVWDQVTVWPTKWTAQVLFGLQYSRCPVVWQAWALSRRNGRLLTTRINDYRHASLHEIDLNQGILELYQG